jgi:hypothetical protein
VGRPYKNENEKEGAKDQRQHPKVATLKRWSSSRYTLDSWVGVA